jgi:hypothetical protein
LLLLFPLFVQQLQQVSPLKRGEYAELDLSYLPNHQYAINFFQIKSLT